MEALLLLHSFLNLCLDTAGAGQAPAGERFVNGEKSGHDEKQSHPPFVIPGDNDARDKAERTNDAARDAATALDIGLEETAHTKNLTQGFSVASRTLLRRSIGMDFDSN